MKRVSMVILLMACFFVFGVCANAYQEPSEHKSPDGKIAVKVFCVAHDGCYIGIRNLTKNESGFRVAVKYSETSKYSINNGTYIKWLNDSKHFVFSDYENNEDCPFTYIGLYDITSKKAKIVASHYIYNGVNLTNNGFSYEIIEEQVLNTNSAKKCESGIIYKMRKVARDFSGGILKQTPSYALCGGGFC